jgi:hypothetical protein
MSYDDKPNQDKVDDKGDDDGNSGDYESLPFPMDAIVNFQKEKVEFSDSQNEQVEQVSSFFQKLSAIKEMEVEEYHSTDHKSGEEMVYEECQDHYQTVIFSSEEPGEEVGMSLPPLLDDHMPWSYSLGGIDNDPGSHLPTDSNTPDYSVDNPWTGTPVINNNALNIAASVIDATSQNPFGNKEDNNEILNITAVGTVDATSQNLLDEDVYNDSSSIFNVKSTNSFDSFPSTVDGDLIEFDHDTEVQDAPPTTESSGEVAEKCVSKTVEENPVSVGTQHLFEFGKSNKIKIEGGLATACDETDSVQGKNNGEQQQNCSKRTFDGGDSLIINEILEKEEYFEVMRRVSHWSGTGPVVDSSVPAFAANSKRVSRQRLDRTHVARRSERLSKKLMS